MKWAWTFVLVLCLFGCKKPGGTMNADKPADVNDPIYKQGTFLNDQLGEAPAPMGFNRVVNPMDKACMYAPPSYEWKSPNAYLGAMNLIDSSIGGARMAIPNETMNLFCARTDLLAVHMYPAQIIVQPTANWSIEGSQKAIEATAKTKEWVFKGLTHAPVGDVPTWERTTDREGFRGAELKIVQRRYIFCWKGASFLVFTDCPVDQVGQLGTALEQAVLTLRYIPSMKPGDMVLPPESKKREEFIESYRASSQAVQRMQDQQRTQDMIDEVNEINRMNRQRQELQNQQAPPAVDTNQAGSSPPNQDGAAANNPPTEPPGTTPPGTNPPGTGGQ